MSESGRANTLERLFVLLYGLLRGLGRGIMAAVVF